MRLVIRAWKVCHGLVSRLISVLARTNPAALLEHERENFRKVVGQFNAGLVTHATLAERLKAQVSSNEAKAAELTAKMRTLASAGEHKAAARYALQLKQISARLLEDSGKLEAAEAKYQQLVRTRDKAVTETRNKLDQLRWQIGDLKVNRALADLEATAAAMIGGIAEPGDGINRLGEMVAEENEKARARSRVAGGEADALGSAGWEAEEEILAAQALEEFLAGEQQSMPLALPDFSKQADLVPVPKKQ